MLVYHIHRSKGKFIGRDIQLTPEDLTDFALGPLAFYKYDMY